MAIISVKEARKLLGNSDKKLTDAEIEKLVYQLEVLARMSIRTYFDRKKR